MNEKIKKFFKSKKADAKFKKAGPGYRLDQSSVQSVHSAKSNSSNSNKSNDNACYYPILNRSELTQESRKAADAAIARQNKQKNENKSMAAFKAQVKKEMEAEKLASSSATPEKISKNIEGVEIDTPPLLAVQGVYFQCPLLGSDILTKEEWNQRIRSFLYEQLEEEKGLVACVMVHTLNKSKEKIEACIETITKYFENILKYPTDEKYRKIRLNNKIYVEKIKAVEGASLILEAAGFEIKELPYQDTTENFLVFPKEKLKEAPEIFEILLDGLHNAEPITLELHRNLQVLLPSEANERNELPPSFFNLTVEEIKREQKLRTEAVEKNQMLRTKAMREKDENREISRYKFALIRIRFPDGIFLQGTFGVYEKISTIFYFVREALEDEYLVFTLTTPNGQRLCRDKDSTLMDEKLVPAALLIFNTEISKQIYLKPELLVLVKSLSIS